MKVLLTDFVTAVAGKIAGTVYQKGRFGYIRRAKPLPSNPQTDYQQDVRSYFGALSAQWRTLTESQRDGWRALAEEIEFVPIFGDPKKQAGNTLFIGLNVNLLMAGAATIQDAPSPVQLPVIAKLVVPQLTNTQAKLSVNFDLPNPGDVPANTSLHVYATPSLSPGINAPSSAYFRLMKSYPAGTAVDPVDIFPDYVSRFSAPIVGKRIFFRVSLVSTQSGQRGVGFTASAFVS